MNTPQIPPVSTTTKGGINLHGIATGYVATKKYHKQMTVTLPGPLRIAAIIGDPRWTEWMPIYTWVIEHPEGLIVIDTGESAEMGTDAFFEGADPVDKFVYNTILRTQVEPQDEIGPQMKGLGLDPAEVRWLIQTHLHSDHMDGMAYFPNAEFIVPRQDYPRSTGALSFRFPEWLNPSFPTFRRDAHFSLEETHRVTQAGDLFITPTHGHSNGHQSVVLIDDDADFFFAGDASFNIPQIQHEKIPGIVADLPAARATTKRLKTHLRDRPTVYMPSHDPESGQRLVDRTLTDM